MEEKNATISFSFYPDDYIGVDLTFHCNEDLTFEVLLDYFKRFAVAMSYSPQTIEKYLGED